MRNGRTRRDLINLIQIIVIGMMYVATLAVMMLFFDSVFSHDPVLGASFGDDKVIEQHFSEFSHPPPIRVRVRNAVQSVIQVFEPQLQLVPTGLTASYQPVIVTLLVIGPGGILINTQSHGVHIYNRETKTWRIATEDDTSPNTTDIPSDDKDDNEPEGRAIVPQRPTPSDLQRLARYTRQTGRKSAVNPTPCGK